MLDSGPGHLARDRVREVGDLSGMLAIQGCRIDALLQSEDAETALALKTSASADFFEYGSLIGPGEDPPTPLKRFKRTEEASRVPSKDERSN